MELHSFNETPEGKPRCSVTLLAEEWGDLAKQKGKTSHTHKNKNRRRGLVFFLINIKGTERKKSWRRAAHTGEEDNTV